MKFRKIICIVLCGVFLLTMSACGGGTEPVSTEETTTTALPTATTVAIIEKNLADILSAEDISDAIGEEMNDPVVSNQGTTLTSISKQGKAVLSVEISEKPIEVFNAALQGYFDLKPCPNLGESAWYSPLYYQLMAYGKGYMILVELTGTNDTDQELIVLRCRQIAALLLERL